MAGFVTFTRKGPDPATLVAEINRDLSKGMKTVGTKANRAGVKAFKSAAGVSHFGHSKTGASYPLKFKVKKSTATPTKVHLHFQASPVGFWCMLESGAKPHKITAKKKKVLSWGTGDDSAAVSVNHPGMSGRGSYSKGEAAAIRAIEETVEKDLVAEVTRGG